MGNGSNRSPLSLMWPRLCTWITTCRKLGTIKLVQDKSQSRPTHWLKNYCEVDKRSIQSIVLLELTEDKHHTNYASVGSEATKDFRKVFSAMVGRSLLSTSLEITIQTIEGRIIPLELEQSDFSPLFLPMVMMSRSQK